MVLKTKFFVPPLPPGHIPRGRLLERWRSAVDRRVTVITAPAGFGKSTAVAELFAVTERPSAFLSLDADDADPARLWSHVGFALRGLFGDALGATLWGGPAPPPIHDVLVMWLNQLADASTRAVLALDDVHHLEDSGAVDDLAFWLDHLPPHLHVVLSGRRRLALPYSRWRGRGELFDVTPRQLALDAGQTAQYLRSRLGDRVDEARCDRLHALCEGWPAAVQLAAACLDGGGDAFADVPRDLPAEVDITEFLAQEVLDQLPKTVRDAAVQLSVVDAFDDELGRAVLAAPSATPVADFQRAALPLVGLDAEGRTWRFHHLFHDFLSRRRRQLDTGLRAELHRRASTHFEETQRELEASRHSRAAGDVERALELLTRAAPALVGRGESASLVRAVESLDAPEDALPAELLIELAKAFYISNRTDACRRAIHTLERRRDQGRLDRHQEAMLLVQRGATARSRDGRLDDAVRDLERARVLFADAHPGVQRWIRLQLSLAQAYAFKLDDAVETLGSPEPPNDAGAGPAFVFGRRSNLAQARLLQGELQRADALCQEIFDSPEIAAVPPGSPGLSLAHRTRGAVALLRGRWAEADLELRRALETGRLSGFDEMAGFAVLWLAELARVRGDAGGLTEQLGAVDRLADRGSLTPIHLAWRRALALHRDLDDGDRRGAARLVRRFPPGDAEPTWLDEPWRLAWIRGQATLGELDAARRALDHHLESARRRRRRGAEVEGLVLRAWLHRDAPDAARASLVEALHRARPGGFVHPFVVSPQRELLGLVAGAADRRGGARDHVERVVQVARALESTTRAVDAGPTLTGKEQEVLAGLADGRSNAQIAADLGVAVSTVKTHLKHLFHKLGARRRTQAVARARQLGCLP